VATTKNTTHAARHVKRTVHTRRTCAHINVYRAVSVGKVTYGRVTHKVRVFHVLNVLAVRMNISTNVALRVLTRAHIDLNRARDNVHRAASVTMVSYVRATHRLVRVFRCRHVIRLDATIPMLNITNVDLLVHARATTNSIRVESYASVRTRAVAAVSVRKDSWFLRTAYVFNVMIAVLPSMESTRHAVRLVYRHAPIGTIYSVFGLVHQAVFVVTVTYVKRMN
jgi:hypothetical protein